MLIKIYSCMCMVTATALVVITGCSQDVDQNDVNAAREEVEKERQETEEVRREVQQEVAREKQETEATRREVMKPDSKEIRDEENETAKTQLEGNAKIEKEEQETREAEEKLAEAEAKLKAQTERDAFLKEPNELLEKAALRIKTLKKEANAKEGDEKEATEEQIETLQAGHDKLEESIDDMKSANPLNWQEAKPKVEVAEKELRKLLNDAKID